MPQTGPIVGRLAVVQMGGTTIGFGTGVTTNIAADLLKDYAWGSDKPAILASGNKSFKISCDMMYIDNTYASQVISGSPVDFAIAPAGTSAGNPKITVKNVVLNAFDFTEQQKGIATGKVSGEGNDWQPGTW
jgi:hypothetical protein